MTSPRPSYSKVRYRGVRGVTVKERSNEPVILCYKNRILQRDSKEKRIGASSSTSNPSPSIRLFQDSGWGASFADASKERVVVDESIFLFVQFDDLLLQVVDLTAPIFGVGLPLFPNVLQSRLEGWLGQKSSVKRNWNIEIERISWKREE